MKACARIELDRDKTDGMGEPDRAEYVAVVWELMVLPSKVVKEGLETMSLSPSLSISW